MTEDQGTAERPRPDRVERSCTADPADFITRMRNLMVDELTRMRGAGTERPARALAQPESPDPQLRRPLELAGTRLHDPVGQALETIRVINASHID